MVLKRFDFIWKYEIGLLTCTNHNFNEQGNLQGEFFSDNDLNLSTCLLVEDNKILNRLVFCLKRTILTEIKTSNAFLKTR